MLFNSQEFLLFLPIVYTIYWLLRNRLKLQNFFIVVASYIFYGWWDWRFLCLIGFTSLCSWYSGIQIRNSNHPKRWLSINIIINLVILGIFKYFNFFTHSFCELIGLSQSLTLNIILPVGISFYTFQALSYSIDVYRKKIAPTADIIVFFAYVSFFPQLVAGPIERATNLLPQFEQKRIFDKNKAIDGLQHILWGLFKKMVVADNCAIFVDQIWENYMEENASTLVLAAILFTFQIYGDFSGYSDIAIGTARLFGIQLKDNFRVPYLSRNVAEFWKRWHISLNTWFVDYVYIPLGGSRPEIRPGIRDAKLYTKLITIRNTLIIFTLSGLWHGANWTYIIWGIYHAILFIPIILLNKTKKYAHNIAHWTQIPQIIITFILISIGWILFRAPTLCQAIDFTLIMLHFNPLSVCYNFFFSPLIRPASIPILFLILIEWITRGEDHGLSFLSKISNPLIRSLAYYIICLVCIFFSGQNETFIYFQF